jgi:hypothetical protein
MTGVAGPMFLLEVLLQESLLPILLSNLNLEETSSSAFSSSSSISTNYQAAPDALEIQQQEISSSP